jgi:PAS domain S-box-containing protein
MGYVVFAGLYIYGSDWAVTRLGTSPESIRYWQTLKGWAFVVITGLLLYAVLRRVLRRVEEVQRQLQENEERLRLALVAANQGLYDLDVQSGEARVSPEYATMLGYDPADFHETNARWIERLHPEDREAAVGAYRDYLEGRVPTYQVEFRQRTRSGDWKWILSLGQIVERDAQGQPRRMLGTHTDITGRKQAEAALRASEEKYRRLFDLESDALFLIEKETGQIIEANAAAAALYGFSREELLARRNVDLSAEPGQTRQATASELQRIPTRWHRKKDGTVFPVEIHASHFQLGGRALHLAAIRDITERQRAEAAVRESEARYRRFFEHDLTGDFVSSMEGRILDCNAAFARMMGFDSISAALAADPTAFYPAPEDRRRFVERLQREKVLEHLELDLVRRDGARITVVENVVGVFDAEGRLVQWFGYMFDITRRQQAERALHDLTGRLLRSQDEERRRIARELHDATAQNLAALNMNLALLEQGLPADQLALRALLADCQALTDRSVQEIRTLSYLLHPPLLDEFGLVRAVRDYAEGFARRSGLRVELDLPADWERLPAALELALFRVLQESLGNVYRHSGSPMARIALRRGPASVELEVADAGRGLPPEGVDGGSRPAGVGVLGMRERLRQLGGQLRIESGLSGVRVLAMLPLRGEKGA